MFFESEVIKVDPKPWMRTKKFVLVNSETLDQCMAHCATGTHFSLDLEATGLNLDVVDGQTTAKIVGVCMSPDGETGYYIPVAHRDFQGNVPWEKVHAGLKGLFDAGKSAIFHNAAFDIPMLHWNGIGPIADFSKQQLFEDTMILAFLRDTKGRKGLKHLAKEDLGMEMIELSDLFEQGTKDLDFSTLHPDNDSVLWYAGSDAICTYLLFQKLYKQVVEAPVHPQKIVYTIEKAVLFPTAVMEQNRVSVDVPKVHELIMLVNQEMVDTLSSLYTALNLSLSRDVRPAYIKIMLGDSDEFDRFQTQQIEIPYTEYLNTAKTLAKARGLDRKDTITKAVPDPQNKSNTIIKEVPAVYDVMSTTQLGALFVELGIDVNYSDKGNIKTSGEEIDRILDDLGDGMESLKGVGKIRSIIKCLSTYLYPLINDSERYHDAENGITFQAVRAGFRQLGTDTGRYAARTSKNHEKEGGTSFTFHGAPAYGKPNGSVALPRIRECVNSRWGDQGVVLSVDFSGVELRIAAELSGEPLWKNEFFRCSTCGYEYERPEKGITPNWIPPNCINCGSDRIGDIHTLTGIAIYGEAAANGDPKEWKVLRGKAKCVAGDTKIVTRNGIVDIESLKPDNIQPGQFYELNTEVLTDHGWRPTSHFYDGGIQQSYEVVTGFGTIIKGSAVHPIRMVVGNELVWKSLAEIQTHDLVYDPYLPLPWDEFKYDESAYFKGMTWHPYATDRVGRYITDSHLEFLTKHDEYIFKKGTKICNARSYMRGRWKSVPSGNAGMNFILGFIESWGNIRKQGRITFSETGVEKIQTIKMLLSAFGIPAVFRDEIVNGYEKQVLEIPKFVMKDIQGILAQVSTQYKEKGVSEITAGEYYHVTHEVLLVRDKPPVPVYDLCVPGNHSFWANGTISHNSTNFALAYGGSSTAVIRACNVSEIEAKRIKRKFDETYSVLQQWWDQTKAFGRKYGYVLDAFGRHYPLPDIQLPRFDKATGRNNGSFIAQAERNAVNAPVQATSASITKIGMIHVHKAIHAKGLDRLVKMTMTIHDELVFDVHLSVLEEAIDMIVEEMTRNPFIMKVLKWEIPLTSDVEFGKNWTVKNNLYALRKGEKEWPDWIAPYFKQKRFPYYTPPSQGNELKTFHISDLAKGVSDKVDESRENQTSDDKAVEVDATPSDVAETRTINAEISADAFQNLRGASPDTFVVVTKSAVKISIPRLDIGVLNDLAFVIERAEGTGTSPLQFNLIDGTDVTSYFFDAFRRVILVDPDVLKSLMKSRSFV